MVLSIARPLRISVWRAGLLVGGPALVFVILSGSAHASVSGPMTGAGVAWFALMLLLRIPLRVAFTLAIVPLTFGSTAYAVGTVLLADPSLLGSPMTMGL